MQATVAPLSFAQQRLWFFDQLIPGSPLYNVPFVLEIDGPLDVRAFERSLEEIVRRHDALRTTFPAEGGDPVQRIETLEHWSLPVDDLSGLPSPERDRLAEARVLEQIQRPFDLARGPLFRARLLRLGREQHLLAAVVHHIVYDAWSGGVLLRELRALYSAFIEGKPSPLAPLPLQYADFASQQREWLTGDVVEKQIAYWKDRLQAPLPTLSLPTDRPRPSAPSFRGHRHEVLLSEALMQNLQAFSGRSGVTLFITLLAGYATYLGRITGQDDFLIGTSIANRTRPEIEPLIGFFVNTLALRLDLSGRPSFAELLSRAKHVAFGGYSHQDLPYERLVEELNPDRAPGQAPMLQTLLTLDNTPQAAQGGLTVGALNIRRRLMSTLTAKFDLSVSVYPNASSRRVVIETDDDLFDAQTGARMANQFKRLLEGIVENPDSSIATLPLLPDEERRLVAVRWSTPNPAPVSSNTLVSLFEDQVERSPEADALVSGLTTLTYAELNARANRLAHRLRSFGIQPDDRVAISLDRSPLLIVGLLGILKAGAAYVPLDPLYPAQRLAYIAADAKVRVLVAHSDNASRLPAGEWSILYLDQLEAEAEVANRTSTQNPPRVAGGGSLAYVLYTSGSTGQPKGVAIEHRSVVNLIEWGLKTFSEDERAVMLASTSVNFDLSVFELFLTLSAGALVVLVDNLLTLNQAPAASRVTFINTVPSVMTEFLRIDELPSNVRVVSLAGEVLFAPLVDRLYSFPSIGRVFDLYGPTEATVYSTFARRTPQGPATIGRPIANTTALVLDDDRQAVPIGVPGELYLGGMGLAREYLGRPSLTAERFSDHPFETDARLYRTGDLARWLPDGSLQFLGRRDNQIKLRGFRVELGEIESALVMHAAIHEALVVKHGDEPQDARLIAYIVEGEPCSNNELIGHLEQRLPSHMIPSVFVRLNTLPRLPNGKPDRNALPDPPLAIVGEPSDVVLPRSPAEEAIAGIWRDVLGISQLGIHENFFQLGGHSLLATKVISRLRNTFNISLDLRAIFDAPTIAGLAAMAGALPERTDDPRPGDIQAVARDGPLPLSFAQQRMWFLDQWNSGNGLYNIPAAFALDGPLQVGALESSLRALVERHEALRSLFPTINGTPTQTVRPQAQFELSVIDLTDRPMPSRASMAESLATQEARRGFDLANGPLVRASLFRIAHTRHLLLLTLHHIVADAWSLVVLFRELEALYRAAVGGAALELPTLRLQYPDFAVWQRNTFQGEYLARHLAYWRRQLAFPLPVLQLPFDRPRPMEMGSAGGRIQFSLPQRAAADLDKFCRRERVTPFVALLAVFQVLLHRYSGQDDILVGTPVANRNRREIEDLVGCFVNTTVIRADLKGDPTFNELLKRAARTVIEAQDHQDLPFESLIDALRVPRSTSHAPIFQVMFVVNNAREPLSLHGLVVSPVRIETIFSKFDLTFTLSTGHDGVRGSIEYSSELFDRPTVEGMAAEFLRLVDGALHGSDRRISSLPTADVKVKPNSPLKQPHGKPVVAAARPVSSSYPPAATAAKLSRLWCDVLGLSRVGVDDNFFELGGNSLLAVRLFADIENEFGVKLPLSSLFHEGTVSAQARFLIAGQHGECWSPLVPIQPDGTQPPFFLVHGIGAEVLSFSHLAKHVGRDQPIFGLRPSTQDPTFFSTVESVAATYVHAIRAIDPRGPYRIGGYSSGGVIAYEMAQQLQAAGARVTVLAMLDSTAPGTLQRALTPAVMWRMLKNAAYWPVDDDFLMSAPLDQVQRVASKIKRRRAAVDIRDRLGVWKFPESARDTLEAHYRMLLAYRPEPYSGVVTVLRARTLRLSFRGTPDLGWRALARGGLRLRVVAGAHDNILTEPRVRRLAAALVEGLNGA